MATCNCTGQCRITGKCGYENRIFNSSNGLIDIENSLHIYKLLIETQILLEKARKEDNGRP